MESRSQFHRREFAKTLGLLAALPLWPARLRAAMAEPRSDAAATAPTPPLGRQQEEPPGADALVEHLKAQFGDRLTADQLREIREQIARRLSSATLREHALANHDEPGFLFRVYRGAD